MSARTLDLVQGSADAERFWSKVDRSGGPDACWPWTRSLHTKGYGQTSVAGVRASHRAAWILTNGPIPAGLCVCHRCDNPPCCNPAHLFLGSLGDNNRDRSIKGRSATGNRSGSRMHPERLPRGDNHYSRTQPDKLARGDRHGMRQHPELARGEANPAAVLTDDAVRDVRLRASRGEPRQMIADTYGVSSSTVGLIIRGKTWRHVA